MIILNPNTALLFICKNSLLLYTYIHSCKLASDYYLFRSSYSVNARGQMFFLAKYVSNFKSGTFLERYNFVR